MRLSLDPRFFVGMLAIYFASMRGFVSPPLSILQLERPPRAVILTAHPDDEVMFFAPAVVQLVRAGAEVSGICLSSGNASGLGAVRAKELTASYAQLGVTDRIHLLQDPSFEDSMTAHWDPQAIVDAVNPLLNAFRPDLILTFDERGVSSHANHIALAQAAPLLREPGRQIFTLRSSPLYVKFTSVATALLYSSGAERSPDSMVFRNDWAAFVQSVQAMQKHKSQLVWYRWLYLAFSRHMWLGVFDRIV